MLKEAKENFIDSLASVSAKAELLGDVRVAPYAVIEEGVIIGKGTEIGSGAIIKKGSILGAGNKVAEHVVIGADPQDIQFNPKIPSGVRIGNNTVLRENVSIHRATQENMYTEVGNNCFCMVGSHIAHDCVLSDKVILANNVLLAGFVHVAEATFFSGLVAVHQHVKVGRLAFISALVALAQDVPPFMLVFGDRRGSYFGLNNVGLRRAGLKLEARLKIKEFYAHFYASNDKKKLLEKKHESAEEQEIIAFIKKSKRGIIKKFQQTAKAEASEQAV